MLEPSSYQSITYDADHRHRSAGRSGPGRKDLRNPTQAEAHTRRQPPRKVISLMCRPDRVATLHPAHLYMKPPALVFIALALLGPERGHAAVVEAVKGPSGRTDIVLSGELLPGDDERFATVAGTVPEDATVWLDGPGGSLQAGLRIGTAIRLKGWKTAVPDDAICASACGLIWLGGIHRSLGQRTRIGFHAAWIETGGRKQETGSGNALVGSYLNRLGLTDAAVFYLTAAPPNDAAWLTEAVAARVGIRAEFGIAGRPERVAASPQPAAPPAPADVPDATPSGVPASPSPEALLTQLYADFPWSVHLPRGATCLRRSCKVRLAAADAWTGADGIERRIVVGVAEVKGDCHACEAILGIGVFRLEGGTWRKESLDPAVTGAGAWGVYGGEIAFIDGGSPGRVVRIEDSDMHQGVVDATASILTRVGGRYRRVLDIPTMHDLGGFCDVKEPECRKKAAEDNYTSRIMVEPSGGGLRIAQTFTSEQPIPPAGWTVSAAGVSRQTAGGDASPGIGAQARALLTNPAFEQGRADRGAYEAWFGGLQGDARAGAEFWAGRRSLRMPGNCDTPPGQSQAWSVGCTGARQKLAPMDGRRKADPDYRRGWNNL